MTTPILVIGATGPTGQHVVDKLIERSLPVRAMTRTPTKAPARWRGIVEIVQGDLRDAHSLTQVVDTDLAAIVMCSGTRNVFGMGTNTGREMEVGGMQNLLAALGTKTPRFAYVSTILVTRRRNNPFGILLNILRGGVLGHKLIAENQLRDSGLEYLILRPGGLSNAADRQHQYRFDQGDRIMGQVSRADVAEVLVRWTTETLPAGVTCEFVTVPRKPFTDTWTDDFAALTMD